MPLHDNYDDAKWAERKTLMLTIGLGIIGFMLVGAFAAGCPKYNVWQQGLKGQAELKRAEQNRLIQIEEAKAGLESADSLGQTDEKRAEYFAKAEIIRATGLAKSNEIIGKSLKENAEYLKYLWIQGLHDGNSEVIYVPTEANLPIMEAGKRKE